jgi:hypothetical protein
MDALDRLRSLAERFGLTPAQRDALAEAVLGEDGRSNPTLALPPDEAQETLGYI